MNKKKLFLFCGYFSQLKRPQPPVSNWLKKKTALCLSMILKIFSFIDRGGRLKKSGYQIWAQRDCSFGSFWWSCLSAWWVIKERHCKNLYVHVYKVMFKPKYVQKILNEHLNLCNKVRGRVVLRNLGGLGNIHLEDVVAN